MSLALTPRQRAGWIAHVAKAALQAHHRELAPVLAPHVPAEAVVFDVGAHAGQFSKLFARLAPRGVVHAFEPSAYALSVLRPALAFNRLDQRVQVHPFGLSDAEATFTLSTPVKRNGELGFGVAHLGEPDGARTVVAQSITVRRLDDVAAALGLARLDLIKADVEGWEGRMLAGGFDTLRRFKPALFLELVEPSLARAGDRGADIVALLQGLGYRAFKIEGPPIRAKPVDLYDGDADYLFTAV